MSWPHDHRAERDRRDLLRRILRDELPKAWDQTIERIIDRIIDEERSR